MTENNMTKPLFKEPTEYQLNAVRRAILGLNNISDNLLCSIYIAFQIAHRQESIEKLAQDLFDNIPHNHPQGQIPQWKDQPQVIKDVYIKKANAYLDDK